MRTATPEVRLQLAPQGKLRVAVLEARHRFLDDLPVDELHALVFGESLEIGDGSKRACSVGHRIKHTPRNSSHKA